MNNRRENLHNFEESAPSKEEMALKRKFSTQESNRPVKKAGKIKSSSKKELPTVSAKVASPNRGTEDGVSEDEFRDSDMEEPGIDEEEDSDEDMDVLDNDQGEDLESNSPNSSKPKGNSEGILSMLPR